MSIDNYRRSLAGFVGGSVQMRRITVALAVMSLTAGLSVAATGVAEARPADCTTSASGSLATAVCKGGDGRYRVTTKCRKKHWFDTRTEGPWVYVPRGSAVYCDKDREAYDARVDFG